MCMLLRGWVVWIVFLVALATAICGQKKPEAFKDDADNYPGTGGTHYQQLLRAYADARNGIGHLTREEARDALIYDVLEQSGRSYDDYKKGWLRGGKKFELIMDLLEVAGASAVVIDNGARSKTVIAQIISFIQGGRKAVEKDLQFSLLTAVFNKAEEKQGKQLELLYGGMKKADGEFSWGAAKHILFDYWRAGTIEDAVPSLIKDTEDKKQDQQTRVDKLTPFATKEEHDISQQINNALTLIENDVLKDQSSATCLAPCKDAYSKARTRLQHIYLALRSDSKFSVMLDNLIVTTPAPSSACDPKNPNLRCAVRKFATTKLEDLDAVSLYIVINQIAVNSPDIATDKEFLDILNNAK